MFANNKVAVKKTNEIDVEQIKVAIKDDVNG